MLTTIIKENSYQDSITLMLLTNAVAEMAGVNKVSIMMGTPANKDILAASGLATPELDGAGANDIAIVMDINAEQSVDEVLTNIDEFLARQGAGEVGASSETSKAARNWQQAFETLPDANLVLLSIPGTYVELEAEAALDAGKHVFIFSDNVDIEAERRLKEKAAAAGLLVMGPDCGTAIIGGVPLAFANMVPRGNIAIVGASGTGIQEISTQIANLGGGISHAIGTGGRDLKAEVGAITMKLAVAALEVDDNTDCIVIVSKPPAHEIMVELLELLRTCSKPVVAHFLGEEAKAHEDGLFYAATLEQAAVFAVKVAAGKVAPGKAPGTEEYSPHICETGAASTGASTAAGTGSASEAAITPRSIRGLYTGGTLAYEAAIMLEKALDSNGGAGAQGADVTHGTHPDGFMLKRDGHTIIDLGDDVYTQGKPHPMIAPQNRVEFIKALVDDPQASIVLLDFVLGYGAHDDMAGATVPAICDVMAAKQAKGQDITFIACICGTADDPQGYFEQKELLEEAGVIVTPSNASAVVTALALIGKHISYPPLPVVSHQRKTDKLSGSLPNKTEAAQPILDLLSQGPRIINVGLASFNAPHIKQGTPYVQFDWQPVAGGNIDLQRALTTLNRAELTGEYNSIDEANEAVCAKIVAGTPFLLDVVPAKTVIDALAGGASNKTLLHSGPPIEWQNMTDPMKGSCVGAVLFEGWASDEATARAMLSGGEVRFVPCHHVNAVGPMGGITSGDMPMLVVQNTESGNFAYCTMNEGIGAVLRFGAYSEAVIDRLRWMRDVLAPALAKVLRAIDGGLNINVLVSKAIAMGDEFHQRNIAGSLCLLKELAPRLLAADMDETQRQEVMQFLADTDQFFLNIMMAAAKSVMDAARTIKAGTIVTAMTRNGENFGVRISGMGDRWFTAPVNTPDGLYFTGYTSSDACPDMGDSAITETFGVGGMAMIAAPAVTRFVGSGGFGDALSTSNEMMEICTGRNPGFPVPTWDFKGICLGIDARKVVASRITPVINTGIAHKQAGIGQIGAGTVHPPVEVFDQAVLAYASSLS